MKWSDIAVFFILAVLFQAIDPWGLGLILVAAWVLCVLYDALLRYEHGDDF